jgi:chemotaxis signal transduction protein
VSASASELRRDFDASFARARAAQKEEPERFLTVESSGQACAFRVREVAGLLPAKDLVPLPVGNSAPLGLWGLCGVRGVLVPVFSLAELLGEARPADPTPHWLVLCGRAGDGVLGPVALGASGFGGYVEASRSAVHATAAGTGSGHVREVLEVAGVLHNIVSVQSLVRAIRKEK